MQSVLAFIEVRSSVVVELVLLPLLFQSSTSTNPTLRFTQHSINLKSPSCWDACTMCAALAVSEGLAFLVVAVVYTASTVYDEGTPAEASRRGQICESHVVVLQAHTMPTHS
jgi:hypothetical protein